MAKQKTTGIALFKEQIAKTKTKFLTSFPEDETFANKIFQREQGFAIMAAMKNKLLTTCTPESIFSAVASVALTGLSLNPVLDLAYLVPRGGICCLDPGYKGMIEILRKSKAIKDIRCGVIYDCDYYEYSEGTGDDYYLRHKRVLNRSDDAKIIATYSIATFTDGMERFLLLDYKKLMEHKAVAATTKIWDAWEAEMCMKTAIRSHYKYLPKTEVATQIMELSDEANPVDFDKIDKEETDDIFKDAEVVETKSDETATKTNAKQAEFNKALERISEAKTLDELNKVVNDYPDFLELPGMEQAVENRRVELDTGNGQS